MAHEDLRCYLCSSILCAEVQGFAVILDLRSEAYYILDPVAKSMWQVLLAAAEEAEAVNSLRGQYPLEEPARLLADLRAFRQQCLGQGFLQESPPEPKTSARPSGGAARGDFAALRAWWCLLRTTRSLRKNGFGKTYEAAAALPARESPAEPGFELLQRSVEAFARAENFFLLKDAPNDCLARSLALFRFLRMAGLPVEHCIGVRRFPFQAHAWVEYQSRVVHDNPARQREFTPLARIPA